MCEMALQIAWQTQELQHRWWRRCPLLARWDEEGFMKKVVRETTVCQEAVETRWPGPTDFTASPQARSGAGDAHNSHRQISHCVGCSEAWESGP